MADVLAQFVDIPDTVVDLFMSQLQCEGLLAPTGTQDLYKVVKNAQKQNNVEVRGEGRTALAVCCNTVNRMICGLDDCVLNCFGNFKTVRYNGGTRCKGAATSLINTARMVGHCLSCKTGR